MKTGFVREVYLRSTPSVDLEKVTGTINPNNYVLKMVEYDKILAEFGVRQGTDEYLACNMFMLNKGPRLVY